MYESIHALSQVQSFPTSATVLTPFMFVTLTLIVADGGNRKLSVTTI